MGRREGRRGFVRRFWNVLYRIFGSPRTRNKLRRKGRGVCSILFPLYKCYRQRPSLTYEEGPQDTYDSKAVFSHYSPCYSPNVCCQQRSYEQTSKRVKYVGLLTKARGRTKSPRKFPYEYVYRCRDLYVFCPLTKDLKSTP